MSQCVRAARRLAWLVVIIVSWSVASGGQAAAQGIELNADERALVERLVLDRAAAIVAVQRRADEREESLWADLAARDRQLRAESQSRVVAEAELGARQTELAQLTAQRQELVADLADRETNAHLLRHDSVHGPFHGKVRTTKTGINLGKGPIRVTAERDPAKLPWAKLWVDVALECTGIFTSKESAGAHLAAGAGRVLVSAPATGADLTVVYGVNDNKLRKSHRVVSNASCTTNCLAPVAFVLNKAVGIQQGFMTTIHAYTGDQPVLDTLHSDLHRARGAATSMIPTSTGAARAVGLVLPELAGKLDGTAVRVPTPNVSLIDLTFRSGKATTSAGGQRRHAARRRMGKLKGVLATSDEPLVSIDFNHNAASSTFDANQTQVIDGRFVPGAVVVRQRVGLLQPDGRHGGGDGQARLSAITPWRPTARSTIWR